jgi:hypothetical protein
VDAVVALRCFVDAFSDQEAAALKPLIPALLDEFFKLMNEVALPSCNLEPVLVSEDCHSRPLPCPWPSR